jgi:flavin-dependent dehydrogenase
MPKYKIIIIGSGPSGSATALELANVEPNLSSEVLMLDKAIFPRPKLCAGGVTLSAELILNQLGVKVDLPEVPVNVSRFVLPFGLLTVEQSDQFRVFDRAELDHLLFRTASSRGIVTHQGEPVESIVRELSRVIVRTSRNEYEADIVIGADGAKGIVRRALGLGSTGGHRVFAAESVD